MLSDSDAFHITFFKKDDGSFNGKFRVQGRPKGDFPNVAGLTLNNVDICPNLTEVKMNKLIRQYCTKYNSEFYL